MPVEIERKFLVKNDSWRRYASKGVEYRQGYAYLKNGIFRVRIAGRKGYLTVKGFKKGISRKEYEYCIPKGEALELLQGFCETATVEKKRYDVMHKGKLWIVDVFTGDNDGLTVAEIELDDENAKFPMPGWVGKEISDDSRYDNSKLAVNPYMKWK